MAEIKELLDKINGLSEQEKQDAADIGMVFRELPPEKREFIMGAAVALTMWPKKEEKKGA